MRSGKLNKEHIVHLMDGYKKTKENYLLSYKNKMENFFAQYRMTKKRLYLIDLLPFSLNLRIKMMHM
ncbi:MAG: hypothetical protein ABIL86_02735 [candidate division WOR-3 bacterium]